jgi:hypothetical protein
VGTWGGELDSGWLSLSSPTGRFGVTWLGFAWNPRSSGGRPWFGVGGCGVDSGPGELLERALEPEAETYEVGEGEASVRGEAVVALMSCG